MEQDKEGIRPWSQGAQYWEKHRHTIREMFAPITEALIKDAEIVTGHSVLDVATGPGEPALSIAELVGPAGDVTGIDPAPEMIAAARRAAQRGRTTNAHFVVGFGGELSFPTRSFDAAVSRFGVMFFPSAVTGVREMLRVLKPERKLAFAVWHFAERNPFHYVFSRIVERYVPDEPGTSKSPDAFRFAAPGKLLTILREAGATALSERLLEFKIEAALSAEDFWRLRSEMSDKIRTKLPMLSKERLATVQDEIIQDLRPYSTLRGISFPAEVLIVSGTKG